MAKRVKNMRVLALMALLSAPATSTALGQMALPDEQPNRAAATQPASRPAPQPARTEPEPTVSFGIFAEPIELGTLIDFVGSSLNINIVVKGSPTGEVVFNAPVEVPKSQLINLLDAMLDQYGFTITYEAATQFYIVQPTSEVKPVFGDQLATTRIIATPNIKPSLLVPSLTATLGGSSSAGAGGGSTGGNAIQAVDELGVLIINATSRNIQRIEAMVDALIAIDKDQQYIRFELDHLAAPIALNRVVGLAGGNAAGTGNSINFSGGNPRGGNQNVNQGAVVSLAGGSLTNLGERITIDPQGNALIFKGTENEIERVRELLEVIDVPNTLEPKNYFAGSSAAQIADIAKRRGLGEVIQIEEQSNQFSGFGNFNNQNNQFNTNSNESGQGGPVMVVDPTRGNIIYYGTPEQQAQLSALLDELKTEDERIVIREYQLNHTDAITISELLNSIITGESQTGDSDLLPGGTNRNNTRFINQFGVPIDGEAGAFDPDKITVIADEFSNQVVIKAPIKQQEDLELLIGRLDRQRAQVYIEALIVSVADNEDYTLAFESQINAGQYSAATNFGLSSAGTTFADPRSVATNLGGLTQAIIKSEYVPLIVNATQTNSDVRILSSPQLLVNDNEESSIVSIQEEPYTEISQGTNGGANLETFGGTVEAGTTLTVTPSISKAGFIRLEYYVELSNFVGTGSDNLPPATNRRTVEGSATVPSNATIVIGGITLEDVRDTVLKVPFVGDIPIVGELFKRTNKVNNRSKLYVFLTPRVMTDPNFNDLKLLSMGPQSEIDIDDDLPELEAAIIDNPSVRPSSVLPPRREETDTQGSVRAPAMDPESIEISEVSGS